MLRGQQAYPDFYKTTWDNFTGQGSFSKKNNSTRQVAVCVTTKLYTWPEAAALIVLQLGLKMDMDYPFWICSKSEFGLNESGYFLIRIQIIYSILIKDSDSDTDNSFQEQKERISSYPEPIVSLLTEIKHWSVSNF